MKDEIISYDVASCDPTSIQVLAEPGRKATQKSYWYCFRGGPPVAYSVAGVRALCIHMTLIRTAILHGFDPYHYYVAVMKRVPYCQNVEDYELLLPWAIELEKVVPKHSIVG